MISVIIPLADDETQWQEILPLLRNLPEHSEVILAISQNNSIDISQFNHLKVVAGKPGRAQQMNEAAKVAQNKWLWFLHADSRFDRDTIEKLILLGNENKKALYYHTLKFLSDGPSVMILNELAVRWRSDLFKIPFGDQGFFIRKDLFEEVGKYREDLPFGEDHIFVWKVRQDGYPVNGTGTYMHTSARKYQKGGWFAVSLLHVWHTLKQGIPEQIKLIKCQIKRAFS